MHLRRGWMVTRESMTANHFIDGWIFIFFIFFERKFLDNIQQFATKMVSTCNLTKQAYLYTIKRTIEKKQ